MNKTNNKYNSNTYIKKCGYLLTAINKIDFINLGAKPINGTKSFYIEKKYDGTPTGEVCAVIGITKEELLSLYDFKDKTTSSYENKKNIENNKQNENLVIDSDDLVLSDEEINYDNNRLFDYDFEDSDDSISNDELESIINEKESFKRYNTYRKFKYL